MTIYESELKLIEDRIEAIHEELLRPESKTVVMVDGDTVVEEYKNEFIALKKMKEILQNNSKQDYDNEYLNLRMSTMLPKLSSSDEEKLKHPNNEVIDTDFITAFPAPKESKKESTNELNMRESELELINKRFKEIDEERSRPENKTFVVASGHVVLKEQRDEYNALKKMEKSLKTEDIDDKYLEMRKKTQLPELTEDQLDSLINQAVNDDKHQTDANEQGIIEAHKEEGIPKGLAEENKRELELINKRIEEINKEKSRPGNKTFVIASGDVVLREYKDEYNTLKEMEKMLNTGDINDAYLEIRKQTKLLERIVDHKDASNNLDSTTPTSDNEHIVDSQVISSKDFSESEPAKSYNASTWSSETSNQKKDEKIIYLTKEELESIVTKAVTEALSSMNLNKKVDSTPQVEEEVTKVKDSHPIEESNLDSNSQALPDEEIDAINRSTREESEEDFEPIVKVSKWDWLKKYKKPILIGLGITAIALSCAVGLPTLIPALKTMNSSQETANLAVLMLDNAKEASKLEVAAQGTLHNANIALANKITGMSNIKSAYDSASGIWTLNSLKLPDFIISETHKALDAASQFAGIRDKMLAGGAVGLGLLGTGICMPRKKSQEYQKIVNKIEEYKEHIEFKTNDELDKVYRDITSSINTSESLKGWEKKKLLKKLKKAKSNIDFEIQYRDDPNFEARNSLDNTSSTKSFKM